MRLGELCERFACKVEGGLHAALRELLITGVTDDSREVRFGFLFCAIRGRAQDGKSFCVQAAKKGAQVIAISEDDDVSSIGLSSYVAQKV